jgi:hypothetical protein
MIAMRGRSHHRPFGKKINNPERAWFPALDSAIS